MKGRGTGMELAFPPVKSCPATRSTLTRQARRVRPRASNERGVLMNALINRRLLVLLGAKPEAADQAKQNADKPYEEVAYRRFPVVGSRVAIWSVAQLHLLFAAFVLAVPIFAFIVEAIGYKTGDLRYDRLAHEFTKLLAVSFSLTATFGAFLTFMLI